MGVGGGESGARKRTLWPSVQSLREMVSGEKGGGTDSKTVAQLPLGNKAPCFHSRSLLGGERKKVKVAQSCPTLGDPIESMEFSRPEYWTV